MSRDGSISLPFADGDHTFCLKWAQLIQLQEATDTGPYVVMQRLSDGTWRVEDISHTIRLGLIGGGMVPGDALKLTRSYVEARPPLENVILARGILAASLMGAPEDDRSKKNAKAARRRSTTFPTERSASQPLSEPPPPSA